MPSPSCKRFSIGVWMSSASIPAAETGECGRCSVWDCGLSLDLHAGMFRCSDLAVGVGEVAEHWEKCAQSWMNSALNPALEVGVWV